MQTVLADMSAEIMKHMAPTTDEAIRLKMCCEKWLSAEDQLDLKQQTLNFLMTMRNAMFSLPDVDSTMASRKKRSTCKLDHNAMPDSPAGMSFYRSEKQKIENQAHESMNQYIRLRFINCFITL